MKLYFKPGACSLSPHIVLRECGLPFELELVDHRTKTINATGESYLDINPKGSVPFIEFEDGQVLTEGAAILQYICDQKPEAGLMPPPGSMERYRVLEWLSYIGSDFHKGFGWIFNPKATPETKEIGESLLMPRFKIVSERLGDNDYLMGDQFTAPDAYLYVILVWAMRVGLPIDDNLVAYKERIESRPAVKETLEVEAQAQA